MRLKNYLKRLFNYLVHGIPTKVVNAQIVSLSPSQLLEGKTAIITGGTSGIGKAIAIAFVKSGSKVIITGRSKDRIDKAVEEIKKSANGNSITGIVVDNSNVDSINSAIDTLIKSNNTIDILVNNAGINGGSLSSCSEDEYQKVMDTNLKGTVFITRRISQHMVENKISGNILNICSSSSVRPATTAYTLSKWGIRGYTVGLAKQLIKHGIVVNGLAPGPTATPMLIKDGSNNYSLPNNPSQRYATPEEIANMAVILTSGMGRMIVGDIIYMTGGAGVITVDDINY